jgi:hypothetical protein
VPKSSKQIKVRGEVYIAVTVVAAKTQIHRATLSRWASRGETPAGDPLAVVRDKTNGHLYIADRSVKLLEKSYVPDARFEPIVRDRASKNGGLRPAMAIT